MQIQRLYNLIFLLPVILSFVACSPKKQIDESTPVGYWQLYDIVPKNEGDADFAQTAQLKQMLQSGAVLSFFADGNFTGIDVTGDFMMGNWKYMSKDHSLNLSGKGGARKSCRIYPEKNAKAKEVITLAVENKGLIYKFLKAAEPLKKATDDPFHAENNRWRIKATEPEDKAAVSERLANYFKHLALLLKVVKERKQDVVSFGFSQGPVKIYSGGIGVHPYESTPESWKNTFYNDSNARAAYVQYVQYLRNSHYKGAGTGDWMDDDYNILLTIYAGFHHPQGNGDK